MKRSDYRRLFVCALSAVAALIFLTSGTPGKAAPEDISAYLKDLGLAGMKVVPVDSCTWNVCDGSGRHFGRVVSSTRLAPGVEGYFGPVPVLVRFDMNENVVSVVPMENDETPAYFQLLLDECLPDRWNGMSAARAATEKVDAVTGATFSSTAFIRNVQAAAATRVRKD